MHGIELRLPRGRECFVEVRHEWLGLGQVNHGLDREIYLGFFQLTVSKQREPSASRLPAFALCFMLGAAVPMNNALELYDWAFGTTIKEDIIENVAEALEQTGELAAPFDQVDFSIAIPE